MVRVETVAGDQAIQFSPGLWEGVWDIAVSIGSLDLDEQHAVLRLTGPTLLPDTVFRLAVRLEDLTRDDDQWGKVMRTYDIPLDDQGIFRTALENLAAFCRAKGPFRVRNDN